MDLRIIVNTNEKITINGIKYFLICLLKIVIKIIVNRNNIRGILFPDKIIPIMKIKNKIGNKYFVIFTDFLGRKR